jgi:hypothetical protein
LKPVTAVDEPTFPFVITVPAVPSLVTSVPPSSAKLPAVFKIDWADPDIGAQSSAAKATRGDNFINMLYFI